MISTSERSPRQNRHFEVISQFTTNIQHLKGKNNVVADFLSRTDQPEVESLKVDLELSASRITKTRQRNRAVAGEAKWSFEICVEGNRFATLVKQVMVRR